MMYFRTVNFSTNLERIGVTDIGRKSVKLFTEETFGMGVAKAYFHANVVCQCSMFYLPS